MHPLDAPAPAPPPPARLALAAFDAALESAAILDRRARVVAVNQSWRRFARENAAAESLGEGDDYLAVCERARVSGSPEAAVTATQLRELLAAMIDRFAFVYPCSAPGAPPRWFEADFRRFEIAGESHALVVHTDVTARLSSEDALRRSERKWRTLFDLLPAGVSIVDATGKILESNPALRAILGLDERALRGGAYRRWRFLRSDGSPIAAADMPSAIALGEGRSVHGVEIQVVREDGSRVCTSVHAAPLAEPAAGAVVVTVDVTEQVEARSAADRTRAALAEANARLRVAVTELETQTRTDFLTGLANRRHVYEVAEHELAVALRYGRPFSLALFDADHFKQVNDRFGHQVGDELLQRIATAARRVVRDADTLGRHGGEEFILLLPQTPLHAAATAAEHVRQAVTADPPRVDDAAVVVTLSAGVATARAGDTVDALVRRADEALYAAKAGGRDRTVVAPDEFDAALSPGTRTRS